jgi:hypothetical protein
MKHSPSWPSWGVLVHAPVDLVRYWLHPFHEEDYFQHLIFRTNGDWTGVFYPRDGCADNEVADRLRWQGFEVALLTFHDYAGDQVSRWNGRVWNWTGEEPYELCRQHGISITGEPLEPGPPIPYRSVRVRAMSLVEGMRADDVRALQPEAEVPDEVVDGPRGALVIQHDPPPYGPGYESLSEHMPAPVFHVEFDPADGRFTCLLLENGEDRWRFDNGDSWIRTNAPRVSDVEGETTPLGIVRKLGMPDSLVEPDNEMRPRPADRDPGGD